MKKFLIVLLIGTALTFTITGCGKPKNTPATTSEVYTMDEETKEYNRNILRDAISEQNTIDNIISALEALEVNKLTASAYEVDENKNERLVHAITDEEKHYIICINQSGGIEYVLDKDTGEYVIKTFQ